MKQLEPIGYLLGLILALIIAFTVYEPVNAPAFSQNANSRIWKQVHIALDYWEDRGITPEAQGCPHPYPHVFMTNRPLDDGDNDPFSMVLGWADPVPCYGNVYIVVYTRKKPLLLPHEECEVVIHEIGHWLGLLHRDRKRHPIMTQGDLTYPKECSVFKPRPKLSH